MQGLVGLNAPYLLANKEKNSKYVNYFKKKGQWATVPHFYILVNEIHEGMMQPVINSIVNCPI